MNARGLTALGCAIAIASFAAGARASPAARLAYVRTPEAMSCPDEAALRRAVAARFGYDPFFPWAHATMVVQIWRDRGRLRSRIQLADDKGTESGTRELRSDQPGCTELFAATALAISIALDSPSADEPAPAATTATEPAPADPTATAEAPSPPSGDSPSSSPPDPSSPGLTTGPGADTASRSSKGHSSWSAGLEGVVRNDIAPNAAPGFEAFGRFRTGAFSLALEGQGAFPPSFAVGTVQAQSWAWIAGVAPCLHYGVLFGCVVGEVGLLQAWRLDVTGATRQNGVLVESVARIGFEWPLSSAVALRVRGDAGVNWLQQSIVLDGLRAPNWPVPPESLAVALGVAVRFR